MREANRRAVSVTGSVLGRFAPRHDVVRLGLVLLLMLIDDCLMEVLTRLGALLVSVSNQGSLCFCRNSPRLQVIPRRLLPARANKTTTHRTLSTKLLPSFPIQSSARTESWTSGLQNTIRVRDTCSGVPKDMVIGPRRQNVLHHWM